MSATIHDHRFEELDYREADGIEVSLLWSRETGALSVFVTDTKTDESFELSVQARESRRVFEHPFAHWNGG
jgi:hypothetical protein